MNSSPARPARCATCATRWSRAPAPATTVSPSTSTRASGAAEADHDAVDAAVADQQVGGDADGSHRHVGGERRRKAARSAASAGWNTSLGRPAHPEPGERRHRHVAAQRAADRRQARRASRSCLAAPGPCERAQVGSGRALAHWVMLPAPRQTTRSPGRVSSRDQRRQVLRPVDRPHVAVAVAADTLDQRVAVDALDRRLAGGVDRGDQHRVGVVEAVQNSSNRLARRV